MTAADVAPFDPFDPVHAADPEPRLAAARACPARKVAPHVALVASAVDVDAVLRDNDRFSTRGNFALSRDPVLVDDPGAPPILTMTDPPVHTTLREFHRRWFTPRGLARLEPRVREVVDRVLDGLACAERVDLVAAVARPVPVAVVFALIGVPEDDWATLDDAARRAAVQLPPDPAAIGELMGYLTELVVRRRAADPDPDGPVVDGFVTARDAGGAPAYDDGAVVWHLMQLLLAGVHTTAAMLANLVHRLLEDRARWAAVAADRTLVAAAVEESLRRDSPLQLVLRSATVDTDAAGCPVAARDRVVVHLQSANLDEAVWGPDAADFDLHRARPDRHRAFGHGAHLCLGAPLARLEGRVVLDRLLDRFPGAALAGAPEFEGAPLSRAPSSLPLRLR